MFAAVEGAAAAPESAADAGVEESDEAGVSDTAPEDTKMPTCFGVGGKSGEQPSAVGDDAPRRRQRRTASARGDGDEGNALARALDAALEEAVVVANASDRAGGTFIESFLVWLRELEALMLKVHSTLCTETRALMVRNCGASPDTFVEQTKAKAPLQGGYANCHSAPPCSKRVKVHASFLCFGTGACSYMLALCSSERPTMMGSPPRGS